MKKQNIIKLLLSLIMVFTITFINTSTYITPHNTDSHVQPFAENSLYSGLEDA